MALTVGHAKMEKYDSYLRMKRVYTIACLIYFFIKMSNINDPNSSLVNLT